MLGDGWVVLGVHSMVGGGRWEVGDGMERERTGMAERERGEEGGGEERWDWNGMGLWVVLTSNRGFLWDT